MSKKGVWAIPRWSILKNAVLKGGLSNFKVGNSNDLFSKAEVWAACISLKSRGNPGGCWSSMACMGALILNTAAFALRKVQDHVFLFSWLLYSFPLDLKLP